MADSYARCALRIAPAKDWTRLVFSGGGALRTVLLGQLVRRASTRPQHALDRPQLVHVLAQELDGGAAFLEAAAEASSRAGSARMAGRSSASRE